MVPSNSAFFLFQDSEKIRHKKIWKTLCIQTSRNLAIKAKTVTEENSRALNEFNVLAIACTCICLLLTFKHFL